MASLAYFRRIFEKSAKAKLFDWRVGIKMATFTLCHGPTSLVMALAFLWTTSVQKCGC